MFLTTFVDGERGRFYQHFMINLHKSEMLLINCSEVNYVWFAFETEYLIFKYEREHLREHI